MFGHLIVTDVTRTGPSSWRLTGLYTSPARGSQLHQLTIDSARNHDVGDRIPYEIPGPP